MKRLILFLFVLPIAGFATPELQTDIAGDIKQEGVDPKDAPNAVDAQGRKQGMWIIWGKDKPEKGYPEDGRIEEGPFKDNKKDGTWIKYHKDGKTPRLTGVYANGRPNGKYTKYYPNGQAKEEGTFYAGKQKEVFKQYHENGQIAQQKTFNDDGKEHGKVQMWYANGNLEFEFEKENGVTTGKAVRYYPNGDVKEEIQYGSDGKVVSSTPKERVNPPMDPDGGAAVAANDTPSSDAPLGTQGDTNGKTFQANGYNKIYNKDKELWMDGQFKNKRLWDGKLYKYDSDGILLKIEIWKEGKYHSDGQL